MLPEAKEAAADAAIWAGSRPVAAAFFAEAAWGSCVRRTAHTDCGTKTRRVQIRTALFFKDSSK